MQQRIEKCNLIDSDRLVSLSLALFASGSRIEDRYWEAKLDELLTKIIRSGNQISIDSALDYLQKNYPDVHSTLADMAESNSESFIIDFNGKPYHALLIAIPILVWTRYIIPSGLIKDDIVNALRTQLNTHILAKNVLIGLSSFLYSIDQLPKNYVETYRLAQQLAYIAIGQDTQKLSFNKSIEKSLTLADSRFLLSVIAAPNGAPLFHWQEGDCSAGIERNQCLEKWTAQCSSNIALAMPGCEFECLLPDAYYSACYDVNEHIRPHIIRTAIRYLFNTINSAPKELRVIIAGFGKQQIDEYRISFTRRWSSNVIYGVVWPLYGYENSNGLLDNNKIIENDLLVDEPLEQIVRLLKKSGIIDIYKHLGRFDLEYCDDCNAPLYANPFGEIVHAKMPGDALSSQPRFH
ncbi:MAG: DUF2863 family protein [Burkholderia sp.]|nr:DUF2863 family protein [Burkholderia sp.]